VCVILECFINFLDDPYYELLLWFMIIIILKDNNNSYVHIRKQLLYMSLDLQKPSMYAQELKFICDWIWENCPSSDKN